MENADQGWRGQRVAGGQPREAERAEGHSAGGGTRVKLVLPPFEANFSLHMTYLHFKDFLKIQTAWD